MAPARPTCSQAHLGEDTKPITHRPGFPRRVKSADVSEPVGSALQNWEGLRPYLGPCSHHFLLELCWGGGVRASGRLRATQLRPRHGVWSGIWYLHSGESILV